MSIMRIMRLGATIFVFAMASAAIAQPPPPFEESGPMRKQIREKIQTMKIWKLTEDVGLTPEQSEKFFPVYNKHQKNLEELDKKRGGLIDRLEIMADSSGASDREMTEAMRQLDEIPGKIMEERNRFMKEINSILPLKQQVKLMVFEERFRQRLQQFVRDVRHEGQGRGMGN